MKKEKIEITEFAKRVERLCDFLIVKNFFDTSGDDTGSEDLNVIKTLKEDAANIQFDVVEIVSKPFYGLYEYMKGVPGEPSPTDS